MTHACDRCSQTFTRKSNLIRHKDERCQRNERSRSPHVERTAKRTETEKKTLKSETTKKRLFPKEVRSLFNSIVSIPKEKNEPKRKEIEVSVGDLLRIVNSDESSSNSSVDEDSEEEDFEDSLDVDSLIQSVVEYLITHDKDELFELLKDYEEIQAVRDSIEKYLSGEGVIEDTMQEIRNTISKLSLSKSAQVRAKILLNDIEKNRYRVSEILNRLNIGPNDELFLLTLQNLVQEELLTEEQFQRLTENTTATLDDIANIIKDTKIGQGLEHLPRSSRELKDELRKAISNEFVNVKRILAIMEELSSRYSIPADEIKEKVENGDLHCIKVWIDELD